DGAHPVPPSFPTRRSSDLAMAADGVFLPALARLHPTYRTPTGAILFMGGWSIVLALSGTYAQLLDYVVFGDWIFFGLAAATLFEIGRAHVLTPVTRSSRMP